MRQKSNSWTGVSVNKETGEGLSFLIYKDGQKMEFTIEEAKDLFPKQIGKHEQGLMLYSAGEKGEVNGKLWNES